MLSVTLIVDMLTPVIILMYNVPRGTSPKSFNSRKCLIINDSYFIEVILYDVMPPRGGSMAGGHVDTPSAQTP